MAIALADAIDQYVQYLGGMRSGSQHTADAYGKDLAQWVDFLEREGEDWLIVDQRILNGFLTSFPEEISKRSKARKIATLKSFYRYATRAGWLEDNPLKNARSPRYRRSLPKAIRNLDMSRLLEDEVEQNPLLQARDIALCELMYSSGMRISEILLLNVSDMYADGSVLASIKIRGKGGRERIVFVGEAARRTLRKYLAARSKSPQKLRASSPLFVNARGDRLGRRGANYILAQRRKRLGIDSEFSAHSLRHSFATDLINNGADIRNVQEMLGHASISTTQNYVHVAKERLRETFWRSHPHARQKNKQAQFGQNWISKLSRLSSVGNDE